MNCNCQNCNGETRILNQETKTMFALILTQITCNYLRTGLLCAIFRQRNWKLLTMEGTAALLTEG